MSIPLRLIQTGRTAARSPLERAAVANLTLLHPNWEYCFFDDDEVLAFVEREFAQYVSVFHGFSFDIQRFDFFRYLCVYRLGGFYFDLDVVLGDALDGLVENPCVFPFEELSANRYLREHLRMDWELGNYGFGAEAGDPFLGAIIENCVRAQNDLEWRRKLERGIPAPLRTGFSVFNTTGPGLVSRTFAERPDLAAKVNILFPADVRDPAHWHCFGSYGVHLMRGSWRSESGWLWRRLTCRLEALWRARLMPESVKLGPKREIGIAPVDAVQGQVGPALPASARKLSGSGC